jgi:hypothetical protein
MRRMPVLLAERCGHHIRPFKKPAGKAQETVKPDASPDMREGSAVSRQRGQRGIFNGRFSYQSLSA